jgi:hypothetical protein
VLGCCRLQKLEAEVEAAKAKERCVLVVTLLLACTNPAAHLSFRFCHAFRAAGYGMDDYGRGGGAGAQASQFPPFLNDEDDALVPYLPPRDPLRRATSAGHPLSYRAQHERERAIVKAELKKEREEMIKKLETEIYIQQKEIQLHYYEMRLEKMEKLQLQKEIRMREMMEYHTKVGK